MTTDNPTSEDLTTLLFEVQIALAAVHFGVETLRTRADAHSLAGELAALSKLTDQACQSTETLQKVVADRLNARPAT